MNITGEYSIEYNIYTMFDVFKVKITNHNLITNSGYEFFFKKWFVDDNQYYPLVPGYLNKETNKFYGDKSITDELRDEKTPDSSSNYYDIETYKQYKYVDGEFIEFNEKLETICIGKCDYLNKYDSVPNSNDTELYIPKDEYQIQDFDTGTTGKLKLEYVVNSDELNGTTEIGVKTNHGRLVSHDIHPPYNLPFHTDVTLKYVFKLN